MKLPRSPARFEWAGCKPWSGPPAGNFGIPADVGHRATATDAGTTAGMAGPEACSTGRV